MRGAFRIMLRGKGFTLLEVMVSVAILGVIMTLIWSSTSQSLRAKDRFEKRDLVFHQGRVALRKIGEDLSMAFLAPREVRRAEGATEIKTFFIGEDRASQDSISFTSFSHLRLFRGAKESDQCKVAYEVVPSPEDPGRFNIVRREDPWIDDTVEVKGRAFTLAWDIQEFDLEYYDDRRDEWIKSWDTEQVDWRNRLPMAVRIRIAFVDPEEEGEVIPLSTAVMIPLSKVPMGL
jgi:general secretion pathway protein J